MEHRELRASTARMTTIAISIMLIGGSALAFLPSAVLAQQATTAATRAYNISAGPLGETLAEFAAASAVSIVFDPAALQGRQTPGLNGQYSVEAGFKRLLQGSGFQATRRGAREFVLEAATSGESSDASLPTVTIAAQAERDLSTEGTGSYAARGASILKGAQSLKDIPQSVTVVTRQQMDDQGLYTLEQVLNNTTGITLRRRPGGGNDVISRAFETNTVQYDGVPLVRSYSNGNMLLANSYYLDRVEILRGAQGLLEGAGGPAGSINLVRKRGLADTTFMVEGRIGSWNKFGTTIDAGGPLNEQGTLRGRAVLDYDTSSSFIDKVSDRNINLYAALDLDISTDTTVGVGYSYSRLSGNSGLYYGVPRYADGTAIALPRSANMDADWSHAIRREDQLFADLEHKFNADWSLKASAVYIRENYDADTALSYFALVPVGGSTFSAPGFAYDFAGENKGVDVHLNGKVALLGMKHDVLLGGSYSDQDRKDAFGEYTNTTVNVFNYANPIASLSSRTLNRTRKLTRQTTEKGTYSVLRSHLTDRATLILGGRVSWYKTFSETRNPVTGAVVTSSRQKANSEFTPYVGVVYALTPQWSLYGSYAEVFQPQSVTDAQFNVLAPMTGVNYEAGIKGELFDGALNTSFAVFRADQRNRAVTDYATAGMCSGSYCSRATGEVRSEGFELEVHGDITRNWKVSGGYTFNRNKYLADTVASNVGKPFNYEAPKHVLRLWSDHRLPGALNDWSAGLGVNYRSEQTTSSTTRLNPVQGGYAVWNARLGYRIDKRWTASLNLDNLFDKRYFSSIADNYLNNYVGEPRKLLLTLRGRY